MSLCYSSILQERGISVTMDNIKKRKLIQHMITISVILVSLVVTVIMFNNAVREIKNSSETARTDLMEHNFDFVWDYLQYLTMHAETHSVQLANQIEEELTENFDLDKLEEALNTNNTKDPTLVRFHRILREFIVDNHFGNVRNNRNSYIILDGSDTILEDMFVDPDARQEDNPLGMDISTSLTDYRESTYNKEMFDSAFNKIRTHSDQPIVIEPYNHIDGEHKMYSEMNYNNLRELYLSEGINGLRNYQFMVPAYITDTGDIFGNYDTINNSDDISHKFIIIQTFNLYDQILNIDPDFETSEQYESAVARHERILSAIYVLGIIIVAVSVFIVLYFFTLYNNLLDDIHDQS